MQINYLFMSLILQGTGAISRDLDSAKPIINSK